MSLTYYVYMSGMADKSLTPTHHSERGYGQLNQCFDGSKACPEHVCMLGVQNNTVWACINRTEVTNSPSLPTSSI